MWVKRLTKLSLPASTTARGPQLGDEMVALESELASLVAAKKSVSATRVAALDEAIASTCSELDEKRRVRRDRKPTEPLALSSADGRATGAENL